MSGESSRTANAPPRQKRAPDPGYGHPTVQAACTPAERSGPEPPETAIAAARAAFPVGLAQPEGGYRFSLDPLLLAAFVRPRPNARLADLGCGCGVAGLAALVLHETPGSVLGLDVDDTMTACATRNALMLGLETRFAAKTADMRHVSGHMPGQSVDMALANPPYRPLGTGKTCPAPERARARFETQGSLADFVAAAAWLLANRGGLGIVYPASRLPELLQACLAARLSPKRLKLVYSRLSQPARLVLLWAVKNAGAELVVEPPLELYEGQGAGTRLRAPALQFCPFLTRAR